MFSPSLFVSSTSPAWCWSSSLPDKVIFLLVGIGRIGHQGREAKGELIVEDNR